MERQADNSSIGRSTSAGATSGHLQIPVHVHGDEVRRACTHQYSALSPPQLVHILRALLTRSLSIRTCTNSLPGKQPPTTHAPTHRHTHSPSTHQYSTTSQSESPFLRRQTLPWKCKGLQRELRVAAFEGALHVCASTCARVTIKMQTRLPGGDRLSNVAPYAPQSSLGNRARSKTAIAGACAAAQLPVGRLRTSCCDMCLATRPSLRTPTHHDPCPRAGNQDQFRRRTLVCRNTPTPRGTAWRSPANHQVRRKMIINSSQLEGIGGHLSKARS